MANKITHTRLLEKRDGTYNVQWSDDGAKSWNDELHRKIFFSKLAKAMATNTYPHAQYIGVIKDLA